MADFATATSTESLICALNSNACITYIKTECNDDSSCAGFVAASGDSDLPHGTVVMESRGVQRIVALGNRSKREAADTI
jgi:hypothetical protein